MVFFYNSDIFMKNMAMLAAFFLMLSANACAQQLCFSPVKEKRGDRSPNRSRMQPFDYKIQVDSGAAIRPGSEGSTPYAFSSAEPLVKIWLGNRIVESFRVSRAQLDEGRNCIYFNNFYETWSVAEAWQAKKLCSCSGAKK